MIFYVSTNKNDCSTIFEEKKRKRTNAATFPFQSVCNNWIALCKIDYDSDAFLEGMN